MDDENFILLSVVVVVVAAVVVLVVEVVFVAVVAVVRVGVVGGVTSGSAAEQAALSKTGRPPAPLNGGGISRLQGVGKKAN